MKLAFANISLNPPTEWLSLQTNFDDEKKFFPSTTIIFISHNHHFAMDTCKICSQNLVVELEDESETAPDDLQLSCGCHFHWYVDNCTLLPPTIYMKSSVPKYFIVKIANCRFSTPFIIIEGPF